MSDNVLVLDGDVGNINMTNIEEIDLNGGDSIKKLEISFPLEGTEKFTIFDDTYEVTHLKLNCVEGEIPELNFAGDGFELKGTWVRLDAVDSIVTLVKDHLGLFHKSIDHFDIMEELRKLY